MAARAKLLYVGLKLINKDQLPTFIQSLKPVMLRNGNTITIGLDDANILNPWLRNAHA
jgi:hypothetical protein